MEKSFSSPQRRSKDNRQVFFIQNNSWTHTVFSSKDLRAFAQNLLYSCRTKRLKLLSKKSRKIKQWKLNPWPPSSFAKSGMRLSIYETFSRKRILTLTTVETPVWGGGGPAVEVAAAEEIPIVVDGWSIGIVSSGSSGSGWARRAIVDCLLVFVLMATLFKSSSLSSSVNFLFSLPLLLPRQNLSFISAK